MYLIHCVQKKVYTQPPTIILTVVVRFQLVPLLPSEYVTENWFRFPLYLEIISGWAEQSQKSLSSVQLTEKNVASRPSHHRRARNIERVSCAKVLGITLNDRLSATDPVNNLLTSCSSLLYVMRVLRGHGISQTFKRPWTDVWNLEYLTNYAKWVSRSR